MQGSKAKSAPRKTRRAHDDAALYMNPPSVPSAAPPSGLPVNTTSPSVPPSGPPRKTPADATLPPPPASNAGGRPASVSASAAQTVDAEATLRKVVELLDSSKLSTKEIAQYKGRFEKIVPDLAPVHLQTIESALAEPNNARDILMKHSLMHSGTATWCTPLRRVLESQA